MTGFLTVSVCGFKAKFRFLHKALITLKERCYFAQKFKYIYIYLNKFPIARVLKKNNL